MRPASGKFGANAIRLGEKFFEEFQNGTASLERNPIDGIFRGISKECNKGLRMLSAFVWYVRAIFLYFF